VHVDADHRESGHDASWVGSRYTFFKELPYTFFKKYAAQDLGLASAVRLQR
jgi:hypothetical protein